MVRDATFLFALGAIGTEILAAAIVGVVVLDRLGIHRPATRLRALVDGYALWLAAMFALSGTAVSLFFTSFASFYPGEIGWYTRICMYPLSIVTVLAALAGDRRAARYLVPFPIVGMSLSVYGILLENGVVQQSQSCVLSGPGGCTTKWINEFGYVTIPVMCLSTFFLILVFLALTVQGERAGKPLVTLAFRPVLVSVVALAVSLVAVAAVAIAAATGGAPTNMKAGVIERPNSEGDGVAGRGVFLSSGCATCHALAAAGAHGVIGPNLDAVKLPLETIVAAVTNGVGSKQGAAMSPYKDILSPKQIADVAAFVEGAGRG